MKPNLTTGLDVSDRYSTYVTLASGDEAEAEGRVRTTPAALRTVFGGAQRQRVVVETGPHSPWISRLLDELGHQCVVANARMLALIHSHPRKTDRTDAESLARLGRFDPSMLAPIEHRSEAAEAHLAVLRTRDALVRARTLLVNHARGIVKSMGGRIPACSTRSFARMAEAHLPASLVPALEPALATIDGLTRQDRAARPPDRRARPRQLPGDRGAPAGRGRRPRHGTRLPPGARRQAPVHEQPQRRGLPRAGPAPRHLRRLRSRAAHHQGGQRTAPPPPGPGSPLHPRTIRTRHRAAVAGAWTTSAAPAALARRRRRLP